jgi:cytochrome oxidase Cu insertion factor (SCO1/SenC/PrrC family)
VGDEDMADPGPIEPRRSTRRLVIRSAAGAVAAVLLASGLSVVLNHKQASGNSNSSPIQLANRNIPGSVAHIALVDENGSPTNLTYLHGKVVILADFMTSCQEECPITTGALLTVEQSLAAAHLLGQVEIVEVTVDAWRDTPSRLRAYQKAFGVNWTLLTGSVKNLQRLWGFFGVSYEKVPESNPPDINWENGRPYTFDINHSDDAFVFDQSGNERAVTGGNANVNGALPKSLSSLLDAQGEQDLKSPGYGSWTPSDMLQAVGTVLGRSIPVANSN